MRRFTLSLFRQFRSNGFFTSIKISSLIIGFSVCTVLLSLVLNETGYDTFWSTKDRLYRISMEQFQEGQLSFRSARSYRGLPGLLVEELPEVTARTRLLPDVITVFVGEQQIQDVRMFYADTNVFKVLPRKLLAKESTEVFPDIHSMAISASLAKKLYGSVDCMGKELRLNEGWTFYISTVFEDFPKKSHLTFDVLMSRASLTYYMRNFDNSTGLLVDTDNFEYVDPGPYHRGSWNNMRSFNYVLIKEGADMELLQKKAEELISKVELPDRLEEAVIIPDLQPVEDIHLHSSYPDEIKENSSMFYIYMLLLIGLVVLGICWINFINLYAVVFHERIRVHAIRMIHGEGFRGILRETFASAGMISLFAAIFSVGALFIVQHYSHSFHFTGKLLLIYLLLILLSALLSMLIPLTSFKRGMLMSQLKGEVLGTRRGSIYRRIMVGVQFLSGVVLISCTLVICYQMKFTRNTDLGFRDTNVIYSFSPMTMNQRPDIQEKLVMFRNEASTIPGVEAFCTSSSVPGRAVHFPGVTINYLNNGRNSEAFVQRLNTDYNYFDLYGIRILAGRGFRKTDNYDVEEVVLNRKACEDLGFQDPADALGERVGLGENSFQVVGIIENYHHLSLKEKLLPMAIFKSLRWRAAVGYYSFRLNNFDTKTLKSIEKIWQRTYPGEQFLFRYMEESYVEQYQAEQRFGTSFLIAAILAILTSCLGLIGLSHFNILKRTKEIGIRKTFGSSSVQVLQRLQAETILMVTLSSLIGIPMAWMIARRWLDHFSYRIDPSWWMFLVAFLLLLVVSLVSTLIQTWRASMQNPVESLRYE